MGETLAAARVDRGSRRTRDLVDSMPTAAVYREGDDLLVNAAAARIVGHSPEVLATVDAWFALLHGAQADGERERYERVRREGLSGRPEMVQIVDATGTPRWFELT